MNRFKEIFNFPNVLLFTVFLFAIFSQTLPLVKVLNFEFSFLFSILLFISSGILIIHFLRKYKSFGMLPAIILMKKKVFLSMLFIPLIVSVLSNLLFQNCPIGDGILYYFIIVTPASFFGIAMGAFSFWSDKKFSYLIFTLFFFLFALAPVVEFYIYPQVYFYNVIVGIIPGTIYDEEILLSGKLIIYRILQIFLFSFLLYSILKVSNVNKKNRNILQLSTLLGMLLFFLLKPYLGFATSKFILFDVLKGGVITPQIEIRYDGSLNDNEVKFLTFKHIYYLKQIKNKTELSTPKDIISYIFKDAKQKGALFGSKAANVAKPWMNEIYLDFNSIDATLEHELTHLYAAEIGSTPFKIADGFNMALLEGYAMAIEDNYSGYDIHYMALLAKESGYNFNIPNLFSKLNFFNQTSSLSYITAGSFVKFLIEKYGIEKLNNLYGDLDFVKYFEKDIESLEKEYFSFLENLNYEINKERANLFFGRKPITKKVCPRTVANELKEAWKLYNEHDYRGARYKFKKIFDYSNSYSALIGIVYSNNKSEHFAESLELLSNMLPNLKGTSSYYSALLNLGDQFALNQKLEGADSIYLQFNKLEPTVRYKNIAEIRLHLLHEGDLLNYLQGSDFDKYKILKEHLDDKSVDYMLPILIELSNRLNENPKSFGSFINMLPKENLSSATLYKISEYFFDKMIFQDALFFANLSIEKCNENYRLPVLKSHKKKVEWFAKTF